MPLLLLWESGAHITHACAVAKTEHQPKIRERVPGLPSPLCFQLVAGTRMYGVWYGLVLRVRAGPPSHLPKPRVTHTATLALYCVLVPLIIFVTADPPPASKY